MLALRVTGNFYSHYQEIKGIGPGDFLSITD
jgi:hypothetical protein